MAADDVLPYGPTVTRALGPLRHGFRLVNRHVTGPALKAGLGTLLSTSATGSMLLLRTVGRRSGLVRETPLGYAVIDGRVVVVAGYGRRSDWFRNALAHPEVEVVLPGARLRGRAEEITDPDERRAAFRTTIGAMALVGRLTLGDVGAAGTARVDELAEAFPMLAITPTAVLPGPFDPGGGATRANTVVALWAPVVGAAAWLGWRLVRRAR